MLEISYRLSYRVQIATLLLSTYSSTLKVREKDQILITILNLENVIQVIEVFAYSIIVNQMHSLEENLIIRYYDWFLTTPTMLVSTVLFFEYNKRKDNEILKATSILRQYKDKIMNMLAANAGMLIFGYLGELKKIPKSIAAILGFVCFIKAFSILETFSGDNRLNKKIYKLIASLWTVYGFLYLTDNRTKNIGYNYIDIFSKNVFAFTVALIVIQNKIN